MGALTRALRPLVPKPWVEAYRARNMRLFMAREKAMWRSLSLTHELHGVRTRVEGASDWSVYGEVFVEALYDRAIHETLDAAPPDREVRVLDLGANTGFFALRFAALVRGSEQPDRPFRVDCVEGSPLVYDELKPRLAEQGPLSAKLHAHLGLAGQRAGEMVIYQARMMAGNTTTYRPYTIPATVRFLDVETLVPDDAELDLLKVDIEGAEQDLVANYRALLARTKRVIMEIHHESVDTGAIVAGLRAAGFGEGECVWRSSEGPDSSLNLYARV